MYQNCKICKHSFYNRAFLSNSSIPSNTMRSSTKSSSTMNNSKNLLCKVLNSMKCRQSCRIVCCDFFIRSVSWRSRRRKSTSSLNKSTRNTMQHWMWRNVMSRRIRWVCRTSKNLTRSFKVTWRKCEWMELKGDRTDGIFTHDYNIKTYILNIRLN